MVSVPTLEMVFGDNWELKSKLKVDNVEVRQLLLSLGIGSTPLTVKFSGEIDCNGQLKPSFNLVCQNGIVEIPKIWVHSGEPSRTTIVDLEGVSLKGGLTIDQEKLVIVPILKLENSADYPVVSSLIKMALKSVTILICSTLNQLKI